MIDASLGHPHVCAHKGKVERSRQMRKITYKGEGGRVKVAYVRKKNFSKRFFFVQKKLSHCHLLLCVEKCKPTSSYK